MAQLHDYVVENAVGPAVVSRPQDIFADNTYYRGALTLHALRLTVGDKDFARIIRTYYRTYRNANATSADFTQIAAKIGGGATVRPLLRAWLYEQPVPPLPGTTALQAQARKSEPTPAPNLGIGVRHRQAP
jgi:aminopeptidase N